MIESLKTNWHVYAMEAICLGLFMVSASFFATILEFPGSAVHAALPNGIVRDMLMGLAMGLSAVLIIYSPMGKLSGAHMNPAVTLTFWSLGKVKGWDTFYYVVFQCAGGILSVYIMHVLLGTRFEDPHVNFVVTAPGKSGIAAAFAMEVAIAFIMMAIVLITTNHEKISKYTGVIAGALVALFVVISGHVSGFGMNPARSLASAVPSGMYPSFWIYLIAPFLGMFLASIIYIEFGGEAICAKYHHSHLYTCIFNCGYCKHEEKNDTIENTHL